MSDSASVGMESFQKQFEENNISIYKMILKN